MVYKGIDNESAGAYYVTVTFITKGVSKMSLLKKTNKDSNGVTAEQLLRLEYERKHRKDLERFFFNRIPLCQ